MPALLPDLWGTTSGFINGMLRLGSVAAFASLPIVYNDVGGGGGEGGEDGERGGGTRAVFWCVALVGAVMWPLGAAVRHVAVGRADALLGFGGREVAADAAGGAEEEEKLPPVETSSTRGTCGTLGTATGPDFGGADSSAETGRLEAADGPVDAALAALEADAVRVAPDMNSQDVANTVYAYVTLGRMPGDETWAVLETAAVRVAPSMNSQEVAKLTGAYATLGRMPGDKTWAALETAALRVAPNMNSQEVAKLSLAYAKLGKSQPEALKAGVRGGGVRGGMAAAGYEAARHAVTSVKPMTLIVCALIVCAFIVGALIVCA